MPDPLGNAAPRPGAAQPCPTASSSGSALDVLPAECSARAVLAAQTLSAHPGRIVLAGANPALHASPAHAAAGLSAMPAAPYSPGAGHASPMQLDNEADCVEPSPPSLAVQSANAPLRLPLSLLPASPQCEICTLKRRLQLLIAARDPRHRGCSSCGSLPNISALFVVPPRSIAAPAQPALGWTAPRGDGQLCSRVGLAGPVAATSASATLQPPAKRVRSMMLAPAGGAMSRCSSRHEPPVSRKRPPSSPLELPSSWARTARVRYLLSSAAQAQALVFTL